VGADDVVVDLRQVVVLGRALRAKLGHVLRHVRQDPLGGLQLRGEVIVEVGNGVEGVIGRVSCLLLDDLDRLLDRHLRDRVHVRHTDGGVQR
jgi:hypothetical protein